MGGFASVILGRLPCPRRVTEEVFFPNLVGHGLTMFTDGCGGSATDAIGINYESYRRYVLDLYEILQARKPGRKARPEIVEDLLDKGRSLSSLVKRDGLGPLQGYAIHEETGALRDIAARIARATPEPTALWRPEEYDAVLRPGMVVGPGFHVLDPSQIEALMDLIEARMR